MPSAVDRTLAAIRRYRDRARDLGAAEVILVATAAVRLARDGGALLHRLQAEPGIAARVVSGEEEAALTLLGAAWGLGPVAGTFALLDIGGGSTEVLVARGSRILTVVSLVLGVVQLAERFFIGDPVEPRELLACRQYVDARLRDEAWSRIRSDAPRNPGRDGGDAHDARPARSRSRGVRPGARPRPPSERRGDRTAHRPAGRAPARRAGAAPGARAPSRRRHRPRRDRAGLGPGRSRPRRGGGRRRGAPRGHPPGRGGMASPRVSRADHST